MREEELTEQLIRLLDSLDLNTAGVQHKFEEELKRYNKFNRAVLGMKNRGAKHEKIDLKTYAKYILKEGTNEEKRELMGCFRSRLQITKEIVAPKE